MTKTEPPIQESLIDCVEKAILDVLSYKNDCEHGTEAFIGDSRDAAIAAVAAMDMQTKEPNALHIQETCKEIMEDAAIRKDGDTENLGICTSSSKTEHPDNSIEARIAFSKEHSSIRQAVECPDEFRKYVTSLPYELTPDQRCERWQGWQARSMRESGEVDIEAGAEAINKEGFSVNPLRHAKVCATAWGLKWKE